MGYFKNSAFLAACVFLLQAGPALAESTVPVGTPLKASALGTLPTTSSVTVEDSISLTLKNHHSLRAIQENREVIVHEVRRAKAGYGPRVDLSAAGGIGQLSNSTTRGLRTSGGFYESSRMSATLVQPLWDGLATRSRVRTAESTLESMNYRVFDNATTLGLDALISHIDVLRRREIFDLAQANVMRHKEILTQARDRESLGADTMADVNQAESRLARAQSTLVEARASLREGEDIYFRLTTKRPSEYLLPVPAPLSLPEGPSQVMEIAKDSNPKLKAYLADIKAAKGEKELTKSAYQPTINLEAGPSYSDRGGKGSQWTSSFDVMGTMRWNVFNSGADVAGSKAAEARVRQARQVMYSFIDDMQLEIENTWTSYLSAQDQYMHYMEAIGFNTSTRDAYLEQFLLGQRSLLDVLDAESELFNSSTQAATARGNVLVGSYRLLALDGTFLTGLGIDTSKLDLPPDQDPSDPREAF